MIIFMALGTLVPENSVLGQRTSRPPERRELTWFHRRPTVNRRRPRACERWYLLPKLVLLGFLTRQGLFRWVTCATEAPCSR